MKRDAMVLAVIFAVLAAVVVFQTRASADNDSDGIPDDQDIAPALPAINNPGPSYLTYNLPYFFQPPVQNFLPRQVATGQGGGTVTVQPSVNGAGDCATCGG